MEKYFEEGEEDYTKLAKINMVKKLIKDTPFSSNSQTLRRMIDEAILSNEDVKEIIEEGEGMRKCKWCGKFFKDTDDFCSPDCLEKFMVEALKKK